jgi:general secretion pathway protein D
MSVDTETGRILAVGLPVELDRVGELLAEIDVRQAQLSLEFTIVSLSEGQSRDLGIELQAIVQDSGTLLRLASLFGLSQNAPENPSVIAPSASGGTAVILDPRDYSVVIRALQAVSDGRSISRPSLLVGNNQSASLNSVSQEPFLSTNASDTVATTSFGGSSSAGTQITVTPQIAPADYVTVEYSVSLSSFVGESADPALPPPRQESSLQSSSTIPDGYTVALAGIELTNEAEAVSSIPVLGDIPLLGELFKSRSSSRSRSRFYVFIRPTILRDDGFEDLRYLSDRSLFEAHIPSDWPTLEPRVIR